MIHIAKSAANRARARLKQLCCLGIGAEMIMPALFEELRQIIPSVTSTFFFADEQGQLARIYDDAPESPVMAQLYVDEFHNRPDRLLPGFDFAEAMRTQSGVFDVETQHHIGLSEFRGTEFYNTFYRAHGWDSFVRLVVREPGRRLGLGRLTLHRGPGERPFSAEEKRRINALQPFLAHALAARPDDMTPLTESGKTGILIVDTGGRIVHSSVEGRHQLFLATHPSTTPVGAAHTASALPPELLDVCNNLSRIFHDADAGAPVHYVRNVWGGFRFRAHWLDGDKPDAGLICITIAHEEPASVRLLRAIRALPLSARQAEVAFLLANGLSNQAISEQLGISKHTAIAHGRWIYDKLNVHSRAELVGALLASNGAAA